MHSVSLFFVFFSIILFIPFERWLVFIAILCPFKCQPVQITKNWESGLNQNKVNSDKNLLIESRLEPDPLLKSRKLEVLYGTLVLLKFNPLMKPNILAKPISNSNSVTKNVVRITANTWWFTVSWLFYVGNTFLIYRMNKSTGCQLIVV